MVRTRFAKLPAPQQELIVQAALEEFAAHGFHDASLNRIIAAAGISKGSMYYYFDGKEDLYGYVVRKGLAGLFDEVGAMPELAAGGAGDFWLVLEDYYLRLMQALTAFPQLAALLRSWAAASGNPALQATQAEIENASLPWVEQALTMGQHLGAVRSDLPSGLLIAVVMGMGQAMDFWLITQPMDDGRLPELVGSLFSMIRGAVGSRPAPVVEG